MKAIAYLFFTQLKNTLKSILKSPGKLILCLLFVALLVFVIWTGSLGDQQALMGDRAMLYALITALYAMIFVLGAFKGLGAGASFFSMADAGLLFCAPVPPGRVLGYGLLRQMGTSLLTAAFLLFQYSWLHQSFGIQVIDLVLILLGYSFVFFTSQISAMVIYALTSSSEKRKRAVRVGITAVCILFAAYVAFQTLSAGTGALDALVATANSPVVAFFPVAGWLGHALRQMLMGNWLMALPGILGTVLLCVALVRVFSKSRADYYEDVLAAAEQTFLLAESRKEGRTPEDAPGKKTKVRRTGIGKGRGASVFYFKHMLENSRSGGMLLDRMGLVMLGCTVFFALIMKNIAGEEFGIVGIFYFATYMQFFTVAAGRWAKELMRHYVYMAPASAFSKLLAILGEPMIKTAIEAVLLFGILAIFMEATPLQLVFCVLARIGFGALFLSGNVLCQRVAGASQSKVASLFVSILILIAVVTPGIILGIVAPYLLPFIDAVVVSMLAMLAWCVVFSAAVLALCRNLLHNMEISI